MAKVPGDSKIPVFSTNPKPLSSRLSRPLANFSNKVRAHLSSDSGSKHRSPSTSMILGILSGQNSRKSSKSIRTQIIDKPAVNQTPSRYIEPHISEQTNADPQISLAHIGQRVQVAGQTSGTLRYLGNIDFESGVWCGVELDGPSGLNDGTVRGVQYFKCPAQHGVLAPLCKVSLSAGDDEQERRSLKEKRNSAGARMENGWTEEVTSKSASQVSTPSTAPQWEWTLGSQHSSSAGSLVRGHASLELSKHSSIDFEESLGILTPNQMSDFTFGIDNGFHSPSTDDAQSYILHDMKEDEEFKVIAMQCDEIIAQSVENKREKESCKDHMDQDNIKDLSEDAEMKSSDLAMSVSYENNTETVSDFIRINRTPSLEDLPMDKVEPLKDEAAGPSKHVLPPPFITSVTSIASLDNGYQGDGEWSRPGSRGADHSPLAHQMVKSKMDPMTDSDFFTESDADMHDEAGGQSGSATGRGDRRAQIIDGTLYGGISASVVNNERFNNEEMESSGVYSDIERKVDNNALTVEKPEEKDLSPEGSTKTVSSKSENSQRMTADLTTIIMEQMNTLKNLAVTIPMEAVDIMNNWDEKTKTVKSVAKPNAKDDIENRRPVNRAAKTPKKGRWDAVMNKIAQGKAEEKSKPSRLKEVKSKVFSGISLNTPCAKACSSRNLSQSNSSSSLKSKSRRSRTRGSDGSPATQNSSRNSSLSDVSISLQSQNISTKASQQSLRSSKKRDPIRSTISTNESNAPASRPASAPATRLIPHKNGGVVQEMKTSPSLRKPLSKRTFTPQTAKPAPLRDLNRVPVTTNSTPGGGKDSVRRPQALPTLPPVQLQPTVTLDVATTELRQAACGVQALGVLVNYLVFNLDAFSTPSLKKELEKMRADWLKTKLEMEEVKATYIRSEEERDECQRRLNETRNQIQAYNEQHNLEMVALNNEHETKVQALEARIGEITEMHCQCSKELERLKQFHDDKIEELKRSAKAELDRKEMVLNDRLTSILADLNDEKEHSKKLMELLHSDKDVKLQATTSRCKVLEDEVKSLRVVFELRSAELQDLRKQNEIAVRDAQQLPAAEQKITTLQARVEDLELQLERKLSSEQSLLHEKKLLSETIQQESNQRLRLMQCNEELQWKLKQSSEVVNALASMSNIGNPLSPGDIFLSNSNKSAYIDYLATPQLNKKGITTSTPYVQQSCISPPQSPKVKAVVEKSDSVSWVLEMDESPEHIVSRLVRKAHSFNSPGHHCHTLPNPHKRQRCRKSLSASSAPTSKPGRARSFSFDSDTSDVPNKCIPDWDLRDPDDLTQNDENEDSIVVETVGEGRLQNFLDIGEHIDGEKLDVMGGEDFASPKSTSSSGGSEASIRSRRKDPNLIESEEIIMINRVDSLLLSLPKDSAGEAMVSEDTSDNESGSRDSEDDERYMF